MSELTNSERDGAWDTLIQHFETTIQGNKIAAHWADKKYFDNCLINFGALTIDFSRHHANRDTWLHLNALARSAGLKQQVHALFAGEHVNNTEDRPALHMRLRAPEEDAKVEEQLQKLSLWVERLHAGILQGYSGQAIDTIVNIGVGGSDLGPLLGTEALHEFVADEAKKLRFHFVSSMEGSQVKALLPQLDPERTLFLLTSKSFGTLDTLANASSFLAWLREYCDNDQMIFSRHFLAITCNADKAEQWGIPVENQLLFWDWVGGRYSLWSVIGAAIAMKIGMTQFREFLAGAQQMDSHFQSAPWEKNLPVRLALIGVWNINVLGIETLAVLPYDGRLKLLPSYLQQLEMESNGKSINRQGEAFDYETAPILWGELGPNGQHAFYQLLHQGTRSVACDFIATKNGSKFKDATRAVNAALDAQHQLGLANAMAQAMVLALGDTAIEDSGTIPPAYKTYPGNQPSSFIVLDELSPRSLGQLIALYEHKVFVQSVIWDINPFDQWGVELGKVVANSVLEALKGADKPFDMATTRNIALLRSGDITS